MKQYEAEHKDFSKEISKCKKYVHDKIEQAKNEFKNMKWI